VIALDRAPQGAEHIKQLLIGSILTVTAEEIATVAALYAAIGLVHFLFRRALIAVSFGSQQATLAERRVFLWDVLFYGSFALVVTSSVRIAGVLLVFAYLIVPAAIAGLFAAELPKRLLLAWGVGLVVTAVGLYASWLWDVPTGPAIVTTFGAAAALVALGYGLKRLTLQRAGKIASGALALVGLLLVTFPRMDQPWLDGIENVLPSVHTTFLTEFERSTRVDTLESLTRGRAELARLRELEQDVRWGKEKMDPEKLERLRQYLAGRSELVAGEELVLRHLREKARTRQRWLLGLPLLLVGCAGFAFLHRRERRLRSLPSAVRLPSG
jgi:zinc/manganese transport system permease protein